MTLSRTEHLLDNLIRRVIEMSTTAFSIGETLRNALRTSYKRLSTFNRVEYAIGEVSDVSASRDGRGSVVLTSISLRNTFRKGPKYLI